MSRQILFFGNEKLATGVSTKTPIFRGLIEAGFDITALIIAQRLDKRSDQLEIVQEAKSRGINIQSYGNLKNAAGEIGGLGAEAAVLASYGRIIPKELLSVFKTGIINIHPSLLPLHRGPTPIEGAILAGDTETGVSIMRLAEAMDSGPVYAQRSIGLSGQESKQALADKLDELGKELLLNNLADILDGKLQPVEQPAAGATYDKLITKGDGLINWQHPWVQIDRAMRAYSSWPKSRFSLGKLELAILSAHYVSETGKPGKFIKYDDQLACYCQDGLIVIDELLPAGSKPMTSRDFLLGHQDLID